MAAAKSAIRGLTVLWQVNSDRLLMLLAIAICLGLAFTLFSALQPVQQSF